MAGGVEPVSEPDGEVEALIARLTAEEKVPVGRPAITVSYAQSFDGSIAARRGEPLRLSGSRALGFTHRLRARHDAILVGIGTVLADDPLLNVRFADGPHPDPVVLDSRLRFPPSSRLLAALEPGRRVLLATTDQAPRAAEARLVALGATVLRFPSRDGRVAVRPLLRKLRRLGVRRLLVEGGGRVLTTLFASRLADCVVVTIAPRLVGGEPALARVEAPVALRELRWARLDADLVLAGRPAFARRPRAGQ